MFQIPKQLRTPVSAAALLGGLAFGAERLGKGLAGAEARTSPADLVGQQYPELRETVPGDSVVRQLRAYAGELRARGYLPRDFEYGQRLCTENLNSFVLLQVYINNPGINVVDQNPAQAFIYDYEAQARASSEIVGRMSGKISLSPLSVNVEALDQPPAKGMIGEFSLPRTILKVRMFDRLAGGPEPIAQFDIDPGSWGAAARLRREIDVQTILRRGAWEKIVADSLFKEQRFAPILSNSSLASALPDGVTVVGLHLRPSGDRHDSPHKIILVDSKRSSTALDAEGQVDFLILKVVFSKEQAARLVSSPLQRFPGLPIRRPWHDKFGNTINCGDISKPGPDGSVSIDLNILPKPIAMYGPARLVPIRIDLSKMGISEAIAPLSMRSLEIADAESQPMIVSSMPAPRVQRELGSVFGDLRRGAVEASVLMGLPGAVSEIVIHESQGQNGFFDPANPGGIIIYDRLLKENAGSGLFVARHEAFHLIDSKYDNRLSGGRFSEFWFELRKKDNSNMPEFFSIFSGGGFLRGVDERNFGGGVGGHSADGSSEFFASFCNSLLDDDWELTLIGRSIEFQRNYYGACQALDAQLRALPEFPKDAPIFQLLAARCASIAQRTPEVLSQRPLNFGLWAAPDTLQGQ